MLKPFTEADVEAAFNEIRPHAQKLVDRFGQAQAFEILTQVARDTCPYGETGIPRIRILKGDPPDALTGRRPEIWSEESGERADTVAIVGTVTSLARD